MHSLDQLAWTLLARLGWSSLQAVVLIALVALLIRLLPRLPAALRCTLWWLVGLQLMVGLVWHAPVQLPLLSPAAIEHVVNSPAIYPASATMAASTPLTGELHPAAAHTTEAIRVHWSVLLGMLWLAGLVLQLPGAIRHGRQSRVLLRDSVTSTDPDLQAKCTATATAFGLRRPPRLRLSAAIASPQVIGLRRPTILLPAQNTLAPDEAALALAHELAHLRRGDLWLGWIPALAQRLFFFHPLVAWAMREYALSREAACDAQVLAQPDTEPQRYGHLLLRLGVAQPVHAGLAGAAPSFRQLKRRLTMLQQSDTFPRQRRQAWLLVALIAVAGVLPYRLTAGAANHPATPAHTSSSVSAPAAAAAASQQVPLPPRPKAPPPPPAPPAPPTPPAPLASSAPRVRLIPFTPPPILNPLLIPPIPPTPPLPPQPPHGAGFSAQHVNIDITSHARNAFALFDDGSIITSGSNAVFDGDSMISINGSKADLDVIRKLHAANKSMLWFRRGDHAYLIRDKAMLERARRIYAPVTALAREQGRLSGQQGAVAGRQAGLAAQDAAFAQQQAALARQQAEMSARIATRDAAGSEQQAHQSELDAQRREMDASQAELDKRHAELETRLATQRRAMETQQASFEKQQRILDRQQQQVQHSAEQAMSRLLDEALAKGLAQKTSLH